MRIMLRIWWTEKKATSEVLIAADVTRSLIKTIKEKNKLNLQDIDRRGGRVLRCKMQEMYMECLNCGQ